jgi:hypothetical protein
MLLQNPLLIKYPCLFVHLLDIGNVEIVTAIMMLNLTPMNPHMLIQHPLSYKKNFMFVHLPVTCKENMGFY